jgi:hypothetical protein
LRKTRLMKYTILHKVIKGSTRQIRPFKGQRFEMRETAKKLDKEELKTRNWQETAKEHE